MTVTHRTAAPSIRATARRTGRRLALTLALGTAAVAAAPLLPAGPLAPVAAAQNIQNIQRIAAVVNDDVISLRDILARMDFVIATSNLPDSQEVRQRLLPQVLQGLIIETLKMQEAKRLGIQVNQGELTEGIRQVESQNRMPPGSFLPSLQNRGIPAATFERQIRAEISWIKVVRSSLSGQVTVSDTEVQARAEQLRQSVGKPEGLLAQIYLPVDDPLREGEVRQVAERLAAQIRGGANFVALAQQFSQDPTAAKGGDMGWVPLGNLEPELREMVERTENNRLTDPVRTAAGYTIMLVRDKRIAGDRAAAVGTTMSLVQVSLPTTGARTMAPEQRAALSQRATATTSCDAMEALAREVGTPGSSRIEGLSPNDLPPALAAAIDDLPLETPSRVVPVPGAEVIVMVCERSERSALDDEEIRRQIENEKLEVLAERRLRDLRRNALIDVRL
ncbi:peptidylprolyl isomerase [Caenispirillum bisanense]|uniref:peptidylprolyl isomerase n=1 Tax=Caenispirillum bisanense TaxID=414052 RepID=UPI0031D8DD76